MEFFLHLRQIRLQTIVDLVRDDLARWDTVGWNGTAQARLDKTRQDKEDVDVDVDRE